MLQQHTTLDFFSLLRPIKKPKIWCYLAYVSMVNEYRRTVLGPIWVLLNIIIFVLSIGVVYSGLFSIEYFEYISYMSASMIAWIWASGILVNSGMVYIANSGILLNHPSDKAYLLWSHTVGQFIVFLHQLPIMLLFYLFGYIPVNMNMLYIIPSLVIMFIINIGAAATLSIIATRYRDFQKILSSLSIIIMVTTPIFWKPEMVTEFRALVYMLNPFYYMVEIIRAPLLGKPPGVFTFSVAVLLAITLLITGSKMHKNYSKSVVFRL